jgi:hypothetical protein
MCGGMGKGSSKSASKGKEGGEGEQQLSSGTEKSTKIQGINKGIAGDC